MNQFVPVKEIQVGPSFDNDDDDKKVCETFYYKTLYNFINDDEPELSDIEFYYHPPSSDEEEAAGELPELVENTSNGGGEKMQHGEEKIGYVNIGGDLRRRIDIAKDLWNIANKHSGHNYPARPFCFHHVLTPGGDRVKGCSSEGCTGTYKDDRICGLCDDCGMCSDCGSCTKNGCICIPTTEVDIILVCPDRPPPNPPKDRYNCHEKKVDKAAGALPHVVRHRYRESEGLLPEQMQCSNANCPGIFFDNRICHLCDTCAFKKGRCYKCSPE